MKVKQCDQIALLGKCEFKPRLIQCPSLVNIYRKWEKRVKIVQKRCITQKLIKHLFAWNSWSRKTKKVLMVEIFHVQTTKKKLRDKKNEGITRTGKGIQVYWILVHVLLPSLSVAVSFIHVMTVFAVSMQISLAHAPRNNGRNCIRHARRSGK